MKFIAVVLSMFLLTVSVAKAETSAQVVSSFSNLTEQQKREVLQAVAPGEATSQAPTPEVVDKWLSTAANIGKGIGVGLSSTAKEIGVAVNDFASTDVGKITAFLIIWNYFGSDAVNIVGSMFTNLIGVAMIITGVILIRRSTKIGVSLLYEYHPTAVTFFRKQPVLLSVKQERRSLSDSEASFSMMLFWPGLLMTIVGFLAVVV